MHIAACFSDRSNHRAVIILVELLYNVNGLIEVKSVENSTHSKFIPDTTTCFNKYSVPFNVIFEGCYLLKLIFK